MVNLVWQEEPMLWHARNPFPADGVVEDWATGAAAAALGGYLRELGGAPSQIVVLQGHLGEEPRPGTITVGIADDMSSGIAVTGSAAQI